MNSRAGTQRAPVSQRLRRALVSGTDAGAWVVGLAVGTWLRFEFDYTKISLAGLAAMSGLAVVIVLVGGAIGGNHADRWRVGSIDEAVGLATLTLSTVVAVAAATLALGRPIPVGATVIAGAIAALISGAVRIGWRLRGERFHEGEGTRRLVVFGAGEAASQVVTALLADSARALRPVALLDDCPTKARRSIRGIRVEGTREDLISVAQGHDADAMLIAAPSASSATIRELTALGAAAGLEVLVLPPPSELYGTLGVSDIRAVTEEDLLGRHPVETDLQAISGYITGRTVLVTGAGGSIGSELCRQVSALEPAHLVMLDRDESALHAVQLSMTGRAMLDSEELVVADIRDRDRMMEVFARWTPDVVFHTAALKHLPLLEMHPAEGVKTNIHGTENVLVAAAAHGVSRFVNISTDKAADPTSVLGFTKRIAERITSHFGERHDGTFLSVRFGNVLGSRGSVLTAFRSQIENGGPITVTHEDVTRYFMTVQEAVQLVIQAGAVGSDGEALVLDMGNPVAINDVAERMRAASDAPVDIVYTGLRPGEKLHEVLLGEDEDDHRPAHPLISHAPVPALDPLELHAFDGSLADLDVMISLCANRARRWHERLWVEEQHPSVIDLTDDVVPPITIRLAKPTLGEEELDAIRGVFESGMLTNGPRTVEFERMFAQRHGVRHAVALANGTIALQAMYQALDIGPGDEVIVPSLTFISSATSVVHAGATPVFAEVDPVTFNIDPVDVAAKITPRTKAVLAVHYAGQPADMAPLADLCQHKGIHLLEDAAEAHGASYRGTPVGGLGTAAIFSFTPTKNITTGEGGMLTTNDAALAARVRNLRNHGQSALYRHDSIGYNWRMSDLTAAVGVVQVRKLDGILERKRANAAWMSERLAGVPGVTTPQVADDRDHVYMLYTLTVDEGRDRYLTGLANAGIEARVYFPPAHLQPAFGGQPGQLPVTEAVAERILSIPMHAQLTIEELEEIATVIERVAYELAPHPLTNVD